MPSQWARLYLRDDAPQFNPGESPLSAALPGGTLSEFVIAVKSMSPYKGGAAVMASGNSLAQTAHQDNFFTSFSSPPLLAGVYGAGVWNYAISCDESNAIANSFFAFSLYVYRPSDASIVGFIYDSDVAVGTEWPTSQGGRGASFTGSGVTAQNGDVLVFEVWRHAEQDKAIAQSQAIYFNGSVDVANGDTEANPASWIQAPHEIGFKPRLRGITVN